MKHLLNKVISRSNTKDTEAFSPKMPSGQRVYCVGDIHGRDDLLLSLVKNIAEDAANYHGHKSIIFLGDYIDRGMRSKEVIDVLIDPAFLPEFQKIFLCGNHEQTLLDFLSSDGAILKEWWRYGAQGTFYSYGVAVIGIPSESKFPELHAQLTESIPATHIQFYQTLKASVVIGDYFFVHAGINPDLTLEQQHESDLYWIRDEFLSAKKMYEKMIVHGHSIVDDPELLPNRICIDTGAYASGKLTCLILENETQRIINNFTVLDAGKSADGLMKTLAAQDLFTQHSEALTNVLKTFKAISPDVEAAAWISADGLMIASVLPAELDDMRLGAMRASLLKLAGRSLSVLKRGKLERVIVRGGRRYAVLINAGGDTLLLAVTNANVMFGEVLFDMRKAIETKSGIL